MSVVVLDQATIAKLKAIAVGVEVRDEEGTLVGYFHPATTPADVEPYECPASEDELLRRARMAGGRPLADILRDLRGRS